MRPTPETVEYLLMTGFTGFVSNKGGSGHFRRGDNGFV